MSAHTDHEAYLRAALHAAAESLEPRGDGLERIRARLRQPRSVPARLRAVYAEIIMRAPAWLQDAVYQVAGWLRLVSERFAPAQAPGRHRSRAQGLLRPAAAMAVVMFIVAAGTYVAIDASTAVFPSSSSSQPGGSNTGGHSGAPAPHASHPSGSQSAAGSGNPAASPSCGSASPKPRTPASSAAPAQSASPIASPTPADSSTSSDTSPAPADTSTTAAAAASAAPSPQPSANAPTPQTTTTPALTKSPGC